MKYKKFMIQEYRGIQRPIQFDLSKESIYPLVGINECGKTTILEALLSFDFTADSQNRGGHLRDIQNLYSLKDGDPRVSADIEITMQEILSCLSVIKAKLNLDDFRLAKSVVEKTDGDKSKHLYSEFEKQKDKCISINPLMKPSIDKLSKKLKENRSAEELIKNVRKMELSTLSITRNLSKPGRTYTLQPSLDLGSRNQNRLCRRIILNLDFIFYFDDFRHDVPVRIPIDKNSDNEWMQILVTLFRKAHEDLDFLALPTMDDRKRESAISRAENFLNRTLTNQWEKFHLEEKKSLEIRINYSDTDGPEINLDIRETTIEGDSYFFGIKDRSKGFFWFFNFVMRLEFNPKMESGEDRIIYLLDEPGSYLHARAQDQLCKKLVELSNSSSVFYCTHSHHLLDPKTIPFNSIRIVDKSEDKEITASSIYQANSSKRVDAAFQPIFEALQIRPAAIESSSNFVVVVEGIYDFLCFDMFKNERDIAFVPAVSAHSIQYHVSWLIAWGVDYRALWDNDKEGRDKFEIAKKHFGEEEAKRHFRKLPLIDGKNKRRLQNLFSNGDLAKVRKHCNIPSNSGFNKTILAAYYSHNRGNVMKQFSLETKASFESVFDSLWDH